MLRIIQNRCSASAQKYYSKADYYSEGQELVGRWGGLGAERLNLSGTVEHEAFNRLCENRHPETGKPLTPRTKADRTVGYDFNFHVPKGVSLMYLLGGDTRILGAFEDSVRDTMQELELETKTRIRLKGRDEERTTGNLTWAEFVHLTSRPVGGVPDPHLHAHCFVFNQTYDPVEERWKAAQFRDLKRDAPYFEGRFHARLARKLKDLGYQIERKGRSWDLAGISRGTINKFSRRAQQIERHAEKHGITDAKAKDQLAAKTREKKQNELSMPQLRAIWKERLVGEEEGELEMPVKSSHILELPGREQASLRHAMHHCFERDSVVAERRVLTEALRFGVGDIDIRKFDAAWPQTDAIVRELGGRRLATTKEVLAEERSMIAFARNGRASSKPLSPNWNIARTWLNAGQQAAVKHVAEGRDRVLLIRGIAGTGKTSLMKEAAEAIKAGGHELFTFAPSSDASRNVLRNEGFNNATTVAELLASTSLQEATKGQVIWVDEAGLIGTRELKRVFDLADRMDARIVLSGDWKQHSSVERGSAMRLLEQEAGCKAATVEDIKRQKGRYRQAVSWLARGKTGEGFDILDELGWVKEVGKDDIPALVAQEYANTLGQTGEAPLVVSPTHAEGDAVSGAIRCVLRTQKRLSGDDQRLVRLVPKNFTEAERADAAMYSDGDVIVFQQNAKGHTKGERIVVNGKVAPELLSHANKFQVYREQELPIAAGDSIRITSNGRTKVGGHRLNNGTIYRVTGFTDSGDLQLNNGWIVGRDYGFLAHGYVVTSHASQGKTYSKVLIAESTSSLVAASREQFYVSVSRGKQQALVFTDSKLSLRDAIHGSDPRISATELVAAEKSKALQELGRRIAARNASLVHCDDENRRKELKYERG